MTPPASIRCGWRWCPVTQEYQWLTAGLPPASTAPPKPSTPPANGEWQTFDGRFYFVEPWSPDHQLVSLPQPGPAPPPPPSYPNSALSQQHQVKQQRLLQTSVARESSPHAAEAPPPWLQRQQLHLQQQASQRQQQQQQQWPQQHLQQASQTHVAREHETGSASQSKAANEGGAGEVEREIGSSSPLYRSVDHHAVDHLVGRWDSEEKERDEDIGKEQRGKPRTSVSPLYRSVDHLVGSWDSDEEQADEPADGSPPLCRSANHLVGSWDRYASDAADGVADHMS